MIAEQALHRQPELVIEYIDPLEGFTGWLVIHRLTHRLCAGGLRVQPGLTRETVENLAATMTLKMRVAGIRADGAKSGIDYDPTSPRKQAALSRFIRAIKPYILSRYSMGPDMNTTMPELDDICRHHGIASAKIAVAKAQELDLDDFQKRISLLAQPLAHATLGRLRSGAGLAAAALATLNHLDIPPRQARVTIQGFGGLAAGAAFFLNQAGVRLIGLADREKTLVDTTGKGFDLKPLLARSTNGLLPTDTPENARAEISTRPEKIFDLPCDLCIPAAVEGAIDVPRAKALTTRAVVCGANLAVTDHAGDILQQRGILVIPDLVAGCGGSLSMEGLFGPGTAPGVQQVLDHITDRMQVIVHDILSRSERENISPRQAALHRCEQVRLEPESPPYRSYSDF